MRRAAVAFFSSRVTAASIGSPNHCVTFHMGRSAKAESTKACASTDAPRSAPVTAGPPSPSTSVVCARRWLMASVAAPAVCRPTGTPATAVPGAISTSDAATAPAATIATGTPIQSQRRRFFFAAGSAGAHCTGGCAAVSSTAVDASVCALDDGSDAPSASGFVARSVTANPQVQRSCGASRARWCAEKARQHAPSWYAIGPCAVTGGGAGGAAGPPAGRISRRFRATRPM